MKNTVIIFVMLALTATTYSCRKKGEQPPGAEKETAMLKDTTTILFLDSTVSYFDTINEGDKVERDFRFKNTGNKDLVIVRAYGSCGCTVPEYPKEPVKPGAEGKIHVTFNSAGKHDEQSKSVTLVCNTPARNEILYLKGFVIGKDEAKEEE